MKPRCACRFAPFRPHLVHLVMAVVVCLSPGCRSVYYATWEKFGVEKRDLLKKRVVEARDQQKEAGEQF